MHLRIRMPLFFATPKYMLCNTIDQDLQPLSIQTVQRCNHVISGTLTTISKLRRFALSLVRRIVIQHCDRSDVRRGQNQAIQRSTDEILITPRTLAL